MRIVHLRRTRRTSVTASLWKRRASCTRVQAEASRVDAGPARAASPGATATTAGVRARSSASVRSLSASSRASPCSAGASSDSAAALARSRDVAPSSRPLCGELDGGLGPAHEPGVEGREGAAEAHVEAVEAGRGVGEVPGDDDEDEEGREDPGEQLGHRRPAAQEAAPAALRLPLRGHPALDDRLVDGQDLVGDDRPVEEPGPLLAGGREARRGGAGRAAGRRACARGRRAARWRTSRPLPRRRAPARRPGGRWRARRRRPTSPR